MQVNTGAPNEVMVDGGEVAFVLKIVRDSLVLRDRVRCRDATYRHSARIRRKHVWLLHRDGKARASQFLLDHMAHLHRWYTSLLGKKASLKPVLAELKKHKVRKVLLNDQTQGAWGHVTLEHRIGDSLCTPNILLIQRLHASLCR